MDKRLLGKTINKTTFRRKKGNNGHSFRLTGYYFMYRTSDGELLYAHVDKRQANSVSGYGVCGIIAPIGEVKFLKRLSKFGRGSGTRMQWIKNDRDKYKLLKSLKPGLTKAQVDEILLDKIMDDMFPNKKSKKK